MRLNNLIDDHLFKIGPKLQKKINIEFSEEARIPLFEIKIKNIEGLEFIESAYVYIKTTPEKFKNFFYHIEIEENDVPDFDPIFDLIKSFNKEPVSEFRLKKLTENLEIIEKKTNISFQINRMPINLKIEKKRKQFIKEISKKYPNQIKECLNKSLDFEINNLKFKYIENNTPAIQKQLKELIPDSFYFVSNQNDLKKILTNS